MLFGTPGYSDRRGRGDRTHVAAMFAGPSPALVTSPFVPDELLTIATRADDEVQPTTDVRPACSHRYRFRSQ
jgi:hypothetical protein